MCDILPFSEFCCSLQKAVERWETEFTVSSLALASDSLNSFMSLQWGGCSKCSLFEHYCVLGNFILASLFIINIHKLLHKCMLLSNTAKCIQSASVYQSAVAQTYLKIINALLGIIFIVWNTVSEFLVTMEYLKGVKSICMSKGRMHGMPSKVQ